MKKFLTTTAAIALLIAGVSGVAQAQTPAPATSTQPASEIVKSTEATVKAGETAVKEEVKDAKSEAPAAIEVGKEEAKKDVKAVKTETKAIKKITAPVTATTPAK